MTKAMWRIVPLILLAYMVAYVDRVNVSFASLQMNDDLKFSATIYGLGGGPCASSSPVGIRTGARIGSATPSY